MAFYVSLETVEKTLKKIERSQIVDIKEKTGRSTLDSKIMWLEKDIYFKNLHFTLKLFFRQSPYYHPKGMLTFNNEETKMIFDEGHEFNPLFVGYALKLQSYIERDIEFTERLDDGKEGNTKTARKSK